MTPLPKPDLEDHPHELWGQNVRSDFVTVEKMLAYGEACAERAAQDHAALCDRFSAFGMSAAECADAIRGTT